MSGAGGVLDDEPHRYAAVGDEIFPPEKLRQADGGFYYYPTVEIGAWVRYHAYTKGPLKRVEREYGVGKVRSYYFYDAWIVTVQDFERGRDIPVFLDNVYDYNRNNRDRNNRDRMWRIEEPSMVREGVGL